MGDEAMSERPKIYGNNLCGNLFHLNTYYT